MTTVDQQELRNDIASKWWIPLVQGIAALLFGLFAITQTGKTLAAIIVLLGIYWIVNGGFAVLAALRGKTERSRLWQLVGGVLSIIAGVLAVSHPLIAGAISASLIGTLIGISAIISGIIQMLVGREVMDGAGPDWSWGSFFLGLLNVIFGVIVMGSPLFAFAVFATILALWAILGGIMLIFAAFRIRSLGS